MSRSRSFDDDATGSAARVAAALAAVQREGFLPESQISYAAEDRPLPIGHGQTNSQPTTVRNQLTLLEVRQGDTVLDVGSGSGWATALLACLTGPTGHVYGVELVPELADFGSSNLAALDLTWSSIALADKDTLGLPALAPFDRVLVSAEARELPSALVDQLGLGGRMVIPVAGRLSVVDRRVSGEVDVRRMGYYAFVPLR